jgi:hypothetical protein
VLFIGTVEEMPASREVDFLAVDKIHRVPTAAKTVGGAREPAIVRRLGCSEAQALAVMKALSFPRHRR